MRATGQPWLREVFGNVCPGCGETYYPVAGIDSGHGECVGKGPDILKFYNYSDEEETE